MTTPIRKKLIEVALPLEAINAALAGEKSIRRSRPSTLLILPSPDSCEGIPHPMRTTWRAK
jgi:hypothetical protein